MKKISVLFLLVLGITFNLWAYEKRDLLQKAADIKAVEAFVLAPKEWVSYPTYNDRAGWDRLSGIYKEPQIKEGEKYLSYQWKVIKLTEYLEYQKSGSRTIMESPFGANCNALMALVLAELCEGKGRFMPQIIDGVWMFNEMTTWVLSAHLGSAQASKLWIPDYREHAIDLTAGDLGSFMSWIYYFFKEPFDKINPLIAQRTKYNIEERILKPYMNRSDFWWQAFNLRPGELVNNWNPWCNFNVLTSFLLIEEDPIKRAAGVHRTMRSTDEFINYNQDDGACEEGPSYWGHAAGKLYDYLQLLSYATKGEVSIFKEPIVKNLGEYIANSYIGNSWVVNFADASAKGGGEAGVIYRYGKSVNSQNMQQFAAYLDKKRPEKILRPGRDLFRGLEDMAYAKELVDTQPALPRYTSVWYPQTEFLYMKKDNGLFFAAKGGFNAESHNHNDVGNFIVYYNSTPIIVDAGVGTYVRQTFTHERYDIWTMQSNYHNLPMINGIAQKQGRQYKASNVVFDEKKSSFSLDIAGAYPSQAHVKSWVRSYTLTPKNELTIADDFLLTQATQASQIHYLTYPEPILSKEGTIKMQVDGKDIVLNYNADIFTATIEKVPQEDPRLTRVWGESLHRIMLTAKKNTLKGKYAATLSIQ